VIYVKKLQILGLFFRKLPSQLHPSVPFSLPRISRRSSSLQPPWLRPNPTTVAPITGRVPPSAPPLRPPSLEPHSPSQVLSPPQLCGFVEHDLVSGDCLNLHPVAPPNRPAHGVCDGHADGNNSVCTNLLGLQVQSVVASVFSSQELEGLYRTLGQLAKNFSPFLVQTIYKIKYNALCPSSTVWLSSTSFV
jgi:hypothetical protein